MTPCGAGRVGSQEAGCCRTCACESLAGMLPRRACGGKRGSVTRAGSRCMGGRWAVADPLSSRLGAARLEERGVPSAHATLQRGGVPPAQAPGVEQLADGRDRLPAAKQGYALAASSPHGQGQLTL
jgi:hypothetical protein